MSDRLGWPTGLVVDFTNGDRIYWSDSKESRIESVMPSGEDRQTSVYIGKLQKQHEQQWESRYALLFLIIFLKFPRCEKPLQRECVRGPCLLEHPGERRGLPAEQVRQWNQDQAAYSRALADPDLCVPAAEIQLH